MRVLFVCVHNSGRSQMAEAYVNHLSRERGLGIVADSAGTLSGSSLNSAAVQAMFEHGIPLDGHEPKLLTQAMVDRADRIISMGCGVYSGDCPASFLITEDWQLNDPAGQSIEEVRKIRDQIRSKVEALLAEAT